MTPTYTYAQTVNNELKAFSDVYGDYDNQGAFALNKENVAGFTAGYLTPVEKQDQPASVSSDDALLVGCFSAEEGSGSAYTFVNMWEPSENKTASFTATFDGAASITVYRKGEATTVQGNALIMELEVGEGIFVTVN